MLRYLSTAISITFYLIVACVLATAASAQDINTSFTIGTASAAAELPALERLALDSVCHGTARTKEKVVV